jgi:hypothetical protein
MGPIAGHPVRQQDDVARHRTGRQKERTVNPEMVPARYNFLYSSSSGASGRPLRGRPRRRVPGTRVARNPQLAAAWPRRAHSRVCLPSMAGGEGEKGGGGFRSSGCGASASRFARRAWDPAPRRGPADLRWQVGMHTARPLSRAGKSSCASLGIGPPIRGTFLPLRPSTAAVPRAPSPLVAPPRGRPFGATDQPAKELCPCGLCG